MGIGEILNCLNCGADITRLTFPHLCAYCIDFVRKTGKLPTGILDQMRLSEDGSENFLNGKYIHTDHGEEGQRETTTVSTVQTCVDFQGES